MKVAIAGSGDMARYLCEELPRQGHAVIVLSRSHKAHFDNLHNIEQRISDYSVASLLDSVNDCEALVSTILDYSESYIDVHRKLIDACTQSPRCKRFIPSEFGGDIRRYPAQPGFYYRTREPVRQMLREQSNLDWTLVCVGWLIDYIVPTKNRYLKDIGEAFPVDLDSSSMTIPGTGDNALDFTWGRDLATGIGALLNSPAWERYTFMSGQQSSWNELAKTLKLSGVVSRTSYKPLSELEHILRSSESEDARLITEYQIFSAGTAGAFEPTYVARHREKFFTGIYFRSIQDGLDQLKRQPNSIL